MSFEAYTINDVKKLVDLAIEKKLKRLKVGDIEIEPDLSDVGRAEKVAESLDAQEKAAALFNVTDDQLLDDPYVGLGDALKEVDNRDTKPDQSKEGLTDE